jgi:hypothetical protein
MSRPATAAASAHGKWPAIAAIRASWPSAASARRSHDWHFRFKGEYLW